MQRRKSLIAIGAAVVLAIIVLVASSLNSSVTIALKQHYQVPSSFASAVPIKTGALLFSNGRMLTSYQAASGQSRALSPDTLPSTLGNIDTISATDQQNYIVFHQSLAPTGSLLYNQLQSQSLDPSHDYWWLYNAQDQIYRTLPATTVLAKVSGSGLYAINGASTGETLVTYNLSTMGVEASIPITGSSNFVVTAYGFVLQTPGGSLLLTKSGLVSQTIAQSANMVGMTTNGQTLIGTQGSSKNQQLFAINLKKISKKILASNVSTTPVMSATDDVLYTQTGTGSGDVTNFFSYNILTGRQVAWDIPPFTTSPLSPVASLGESMGIVSDQSSNYYLVGTNLDKISLPDSTFSTTVTGAGTAVALRVGSDPTTLIANLDTASATARDTVYSRLTADGYNPMLLSIMFTVSNDQQAGE